MLFRSENGEPAQAVEGRVRQVRSFRLQNLQAPNRPGKAQGLRLAKMVQAIQFNGFIHDEWRHNTNAAGGVPRSRKAIDEGDNKVTVKVKGQSAVLEASGLQDAGHILEDGGLI